MKHISGVILVLLMSFPIVLGQCSDADKKKLEAFDRAWGESSRAGDREALQRIYADNFMGLSLTGMVNKSQSIDDAIKQAARDKANPQGADRITHDYYMITCTPRSATITHRNIITAKVDGKDSTFYSRSIHVLEKQGDVWQVVSNAGHPLNDEGELLYLEMEWADADQKGDAAWFERNFAEDFYSISSQTGKLNSKTDELADLKNRKEVIDSAMASDMVVRIEGNTGVVTGVYHLKGRDDKGQPMDRRIRYTDVYVKRNGRWQVIGSQGTTMQ